MIKNESCVHLQGWMYQLGLKDKELLVYATIYSFTNWTNDHCYHWSAWYLSEWALCSRRNIVRILKRLEELWLIIKKERYVNGIKFVDYFTGWDATSQGDETWCLEGGWDVTSHHNNRVIDKDREDNNSNNIYSPENEICIKNEEFPEIEHPQAPVEWLGFYDFEDPYVQSMMKNKNFWNNNWKSLQKLMKKGYNMETIKTVCAFIKQDEFWCKNIRSLNKLLERNRDWVMYIDVMIDKIKQRKPKVIDLDNLY